jgi:hypothetical protein
VTCFLNDLPGNWGKLLWTVAQFLIMQGILSECLERGEYPSVIITFSILGS